MKQKITLFLILLGFNLGFAQTINPAHVINLCSNQTVPGKTPTTNVYNNLYTACSGFLPLSNAITLYYVEIESGSTFTFTVTPNANVDFDFASWLNPNFANLGPSDRGSQNTVIGVNIYDVGLSLLEPTQLCETPGSAPPNTGVIPGMVRWYDVVPGDGILIAIDHWESSVVNYDLSFGGDAVLNCSVIGKTYEVCDWDRDGVENFDLNTIKDEINNINKTFTIDFFENQADANNIFSSNVLTSPYTVSTSNSPKTIYARFKRANGLLARVTEINFIVNEVANLPLTNLEIEACDFDQTKNEYFDLTTIEPFINNINTATVSYKYYENQQNALNDASNNIANPTNYLSKAKTIYVQITTNGKCPFVAPLKLLVDTLSFPPKTIDYSEFCAEQASDGLVYNLEESIDYFIEGQVKSDFEITFYNNQNNAINKTNPITQTTKYKVPFNTQETVYVRIENLKGCFILSELNLDSKKRVTKNDLYNIACDPYILEQLPPGYNYFTEPNGKGTLLKPYTKDAVIYGKRTIYIHGNSLFVNPDYPDFNSCTYDTAFTVYNNDCMIPKGISPNGDGQNDYWDLTPFGVAKLEIYNRLGSLVYSHGPGYTNEWNGQTNNNGLLPSGTYFYNVVTLNGVKTGWVEVVREVK